MKRLRWAAAVVLAAGCGDSPIEPNDIAGTYAAGTFTILLNGVTTNLLGQGATVSLTLNQDRTTTGRVTIPVIAGVQSTVVDDDLAGTFTVASGVVRLTSAAASYLDGYAFTADPPELRAYVTFQAPNAGQLTLILVRQ
jgi:hypothetical protein